MEGLDLAGVLGTLSSGARAAWARWDCQVCVAFPAEPQLLFIFPACHFSELHSRSSLSLFV